MKRNTLTRGTSIRSARFAQWVVLACLMLSVSESWSAGRLYRFVNGDGRTEISSSIPNDRVKHGYDVLDETGRVLQRIPPQLTEAQIEEKRALEAAHRECEENWRRVSAMYQTEADIDRVKRQNLDAQDTAIANEQANLLVARNQHDELLSQAARMERAGSSLSTMLIQNIERASSQIKVLEGSIRSREAAKQAIEARFEAERDAFRQGECPAPPG